MTSPIIRPTLQAVIGQPRFLPVVTIHNLESALALGEALLAAEVTAIEVTLRTRCALEAISALAQEYPELTVGAGTILSSHDAQLAQQAGAQFLVSPGLVPELLESQTPTSSVNAEAIPYLPGVATASEMIRVLSAGLTEAKLFPAESVGGIQLLKAVASPMPTLQFCPTGGIDRSSYQSYLALPNVFTVGGSWMVPEQLIRDKAWQEITAACL